MITDGLNDSNAIFSLRRSKKITAGVYGHIYVATDPTNDREIVVKRNIVITNVDFSGALREMDIMNMVNGHPCIVNLYQIIIGQPFAKPMTPLMNNQDREDYIYFAMERAKCDLFDLVQQKKNQEVTDLYLPLMVHILLGVEYLHGKNIMHLDIKTSNVLIDYQNHAILCDFGMSRWHFWRFDTQEHKFPGFICTFPYRPPEVIRMAPYTLSADIWSLGCVFYEMITGAFFNHLDRGHSKSILSYIKNRLNKPISFYLNPFRNRFRREGVFEKICDLMSGMLCFNPEDRLTATQCLDHPLFEPYRDIIAQVRKSYPPIPFPIEKLTIKHTHFRELVYANYANVLQNIPRDSYGVVSKPSGVVPFKVRNFVDLCPPHVVFHALDMCERYNILCPEPQETAYMSILYMAMKYHDCFVSFGTVYMFFMGTRDFSYGDFLDLEVQIIQLLGFRFYRTNLYDLVSRIRSIRSHSLYLLKYMEKFEEGEYNIETLPEHFLEQLDALCQT